MDQICCLLGLCCVPLVREESVTAMFTSWGAEQASAVIIARKLIAAIDASPLGHLMQAIAKHAGEK